MKSPSSLSPAEEKRYAELQQIALEFARKGETELLAPMLEAGMPVNLADAKGNTLLMLAAYHGNAETVRLLLRHGAEVDRRNDRGQTPLGGVAFKGDTTVAKLLLDAGAEIEADNGRGLTPIMFAALFGRSEMVKLLQERGARFESSRKLKLAGWFLKPIFKGASLLFNGLRRCGKINR